MAFTPVAIYLLYFIFSNPDSHLCTVEDRSDSCSSEVSQPICILYTGDDCSSYTGLCQKTVENGCLSCTDSSVVGYTFGECQRPELPQLCAVSDLDAECSQEAAPTCGYAESHRLGHHNVYTRSSYNACDACKDEKVAFRVAGECTESSLGICEKKDNNKDCSNIRAASCAYYTGNDCSEKVCKKTVKNSCFACQDSTVLFYVNGACETSVSQDAQIFSAPTEVAERPPIVVNYQGDDAPQDIHLDDGSDENDSDIPELEAVVQPDGSILYERVDPEPKSELEPEIECRQGQTGQIPKLEGTIQQDGSILFDLAEPTVEVAEEGIVESLPECRLNQTDQTEIPELEAVTQPDGTILYELVQTATEDPLPESPSIPLLEAIIQPDGSIIYEKAQSPSDSNPFMEIGGIPQLEAVTQADGTVTYQLSKTFLEEPTNIPYLDAVVQADGTSVYTLASPITAESQNGPSFEAVEKRN